jgi:GMP synthase-like glutamine amidotransferase
LRKFILARHLLEIIPMRLQVFQHVAFEGPGEIARWARERGQELAMTPWHDGAGAPDLAKVDGLIVMGGPMNIYEHRAHPWLPAEKEFLARALEQGRPVVGICLGAQLLADVLGGRVHQNPVKEIGWWPVKWRAAARTAPGWDFLPRASTPLHWHGDTFSLPPGAQWLAETGECPRQAFAWGRQALGLQFHLEANETSLKALIKNCGDELTPGGPKVQTAAKLRQGLARHQPGNLPLLWKLLDEWFR